MEEPRIPERAPLFETRNLASTLLTTPHHWPAVPPVADSLTSIPSVMYLRFFGILVCEERPDPTSGTLSARTPEHGLSLCTWRSSGESETRMSSLDLGLPWCLVGEADMKTHQTWSNRAGSLNSKNKPAFWPSKLCSQVSGGKILWCGWCREMLKIVKTNHKSGKKASYFTTEFWSHAVCDLKKARNPVAFMVQPATCIIFGLKKQYAIEFNLFCELHFLAKAQRLQQYGGVESLRCFPVDLTHSPHRESGAPETERFQGEVRQILAICMVFAFFTAAETWPCSESIETPDSTTFVWPTSLRHESLTPFTLHFINQATLAGQYMYHVSIVLWGCACVVFPLPVSPTRTTTRCCRTAFTISCRFETELFEKSVVKQSSWQSSRNARIGSSGVWEASLKIWSSNSCIRTRRQPSFTFQDFGRTRPLGPTFCGAHPIKWDPMGSSGSPSENLRCLSVRKIWAYGSSIAAWH